MEATCGRCGRRMAYREVSVIEVKEMVRLWLAGHSLREMTTLAGVDRKTVAATCRPRRMSGWSVRTVRAGSATSCSGRWLARCAPTDRAAPGWPGSRSWALVFRSFACAGLGPADGDDTPVRVVRGS
jgi:hypothetical protein